MKPEEFVDLVAGLETTYQQDKDHPSCDAESSLNSVIGVARDIEAQTLAQIEGLLASKLFDELGARVMGLIRGAVVVVRHKGVEVRVASVEIRDDAVVLDLVKAGKDDA